MAKKSFAGNEVKGRKSSIFIVLAVLVIACLIAVYGFTTPFKSNNPGSNMTAANSNKIRLKGAKEIRFGIDIRGGVEAVFVPDGYDGIPSEGELAAAAEVINFRLDQLQILDRDVTMSPSTGRIVVRFPWKSDESKFDPAEAISELGAMALLTFTDPQGEVVIDGSDVDEAAAVYNPQTNEPVVQLKLKSSGREKFYEATKRLAATQGAITISLDDNIISAPTVRTPIDSDTSIIEGNFTQETAMDLAAKINGGALPFALKAETSKTISPKLGSSSLDVMVKAGVLAFILIAVFVIVRYRLPGIVGVISLAIQAAGILLAISIPQQTLTLQGIAGIILSIGMGVDACVIISERIKEEAETGVTLGTFLYRGFTRSLSTVVDSNLTTAIAAVVLMLLGSGTILSFGYSLFVGVLLNAVTGVWLTRVMIASLSEFKCFKNPVLYGKKK